MYLLNFISCVPFHLVFNEYFVGFCCICHTPFTMSSFLMYPFTDTPTCCPKCDASAKLCARRAEKNKIWMDPCILGKLIFNPIQKKKNSVGFCCIYQIRSNSVGFCCIYHTLYYVIRLSSCLMYPFIDTPTCCPKRDASAKLRARRAQKDKSGVSWMHPCVLGKLVFQSNIKQIRLGPIHSQWKSNYLFSAPF